MVYGGDALGMVLGGGGVRPAAAIVDAYQTGRSDALAPLKACGVTSEDVDDAVDWWKYNGDPHHWSVEVLSKLAAALKEMGL